METVETNDAVNDDNGTGGSNGTFNLEQEVYFTMVVDEVPYTVKYRVVEKIETYDGVNYTIQALSDQDDLRINELIEEQKISVNFRLNAESLRTTREAAMAKARGYFLNLVRQLTE